MIKTQWTKTEVTEGETQWEHPECPGLIVATHSDMTGNGQWGYGLFVPGTIPAIQTFENGKFYEAILAGQKWLEAHPSEIGRERTWPR